MVYIKHLLADWAKNYIFSVQELSIFWLLFLMPLITWHSCPHPPCRRRTSAASTAYEREERGGGGSSRRDGGEESARSRREAGGRGAAAGRDRPVREAWPEHRDPANRYLRYFATRKKTVEPRYYLMLGGGGLWGPTASHGWSVELIDLFLWLRSSPCIFVPDMKLLYTVRKVLADSAVFDW